MSVNAFQGWLALPIEERKRIRDEKAVEEVAELKSRLSPAKLLDATRRLKQIPQSMLRLYLRCLTRKASPIDAIKMQCYECMGWQREDVPQCSTPACPLYEYRPGR